MRFLTRLRRYSNTVIDVIPFWSRRPWFTMLLHLSEMNPTSCSDCRSSVPRSVHAPSSIEATPYGLKAESQRSLELGFSQEVVATLLQARRSSTNSMYLKIQYVSVAQQQSWNTASPQGGSGPCVLTNGAWEGPKLKYFECSSFSPFCHNRGKMGSEPSRQSIHESMPEN